MEQPEISVILPIYNEKGNLAALTQEIISALIPIQKAFEIVCVDDGSKDGSVETLQELQQKDTRIVLVRHIRNFGQSAAQATGFRYARGNILITLDADGQNNPADIPHLLSLLPGYDCVCGVRRKRQDTWVRRMSSKIGNGVRNWITGDQIQDAGCTFRVFYRSALLEIPIFNGMHRFLPTLLRFKGKRVIETVIDHRPRTWGETKYGIRNRAWRGLLDCIAIRWCKMRCFPAARTDEVK